MKKIRVGIIGVGNCASSLIQGINYYKSKDKNSAVGILHWEIGGFTPSDINIVAAFDIDSRKVNKHISEAIYAKPNCTKVFSSLLNSNNVKVKMGQPLDGFSEDMKTNDPEKAFKLSSQKPMTKEEIVKHLKQQKVEILLNYLPVGSEAATHFYAECAIEANCAFINNIPVFIASNQSWANKFKKAQLPVIGDDIKSQIGATITHRTLVSLFEKRGVKLDKTYQLNTGGNSDFLNMLNRNRLISKKISKTQAIQSIMNEPLNSADIHVGPSDYVPWQNDNKICFIRMEGRIFGDIPINLELRLSVEDSPNSAGTAIDAIRCAKLALERGHYGSLEAPSCYLFKRPLVQYEDSEAFTKIEAYINQ